MKDKISIRIPKLAPLISHSDCLLLMGSCFTEHMSKRLNNYGVSTLANPSGTLYNPVSICTALRRYLRKELVSEDQLVLEGELFHHWDFHTQYSNTNPEVAVTAINEQISNAHSFLQKTDWLVITLGSAYQYKLADNGYGVSNCHRVPTKQFTKVLLSVAEMYFMLSSIIKDVRELRPKLQILLTISPVRHIRDGVMENNRSKARLIELVHGLFEENEFVHYFPAYELVIDVLRDYRYYDADLVHPNYAATQYVWDQLMQSSFDPDSVKIFSELNDLILAYGHRTYHPETMAHQAFLKKYKNKSQALAAANPTLDLEKYVRYFETSFTH